jgi:hypothetical protein
VAEEINAFPLAALLPGGTSQNGGWGRNGTDGNAREGTFYVDVNGLAVGSAPVPEAGFVQPIAQFGRERAEFVAVTGVVTSAASFSRIRYLFGVPRRADRQRIARDHPRCTGRRRAPRPAIFQFPRWNRRRAPRSHGRFLSADRGPLAVRSTRRG